MDKTKTVIPVVNRKINNNTILTELNATIKIVYTTR